MDTAVQDAEIVESDPVTAELVPVARVQGSTELIHASTPAERVEQATAMATELDKVIKAQGMRTKVGRSKVVRPDGSEAWEDRYHVNVEGWQTLATFLGIAAVPVWTRRVIDPTTGQPEHVEYEVREKSYHPKAQGGGLKSERTFTVAGYSWEARVEVYKDGVLVGAGEAMCGRSEGAWKDRDDYALRGMAQTRATSRAIGAAARWIVTLAGYSSTPAEEMPTEPPGPVTPPFGPAAAVSQVEQARRALAWLLNVPADGQAVTNVLGRLNEDASDYLPVVSLRAACHTVNALKTIQHERQPTK